jgi:hypothetical protein
VRGVVCYFRALAETPVHLDRHLLPHHLSMTNVPFKAIVPRIFLEARHSDAASRHYRVFCKRRPTPALGLGVSWNVRARIDLSPVITTTPFSSQLHLYQAEW